MEVMRDCADNCVVVCSIENLDPMGVHTGDSITVAPTQTLSDREYQLMRDASFAVIREIGVETGGSNIQFAVNPENGRMVVIEMNPRVSRSSALASKATGFPIAKIAAKLAVGYTLDEIRNDITRETPASFEPTIDYCVVKVPRFTFEKFPQADAVLTTQMKSVGEAMAIGRTFKEALQKALRSLEIKRFGLIGDGAEKRVDAETLRLKLTSPNAERIFYVAQAFQDGMSIEEVFELTKIDRWFLHNIRQIVQETAKLATTDLRKAKKLGFSDRQIAIARGVREMDVRAERKAAGVIPTYRLVDTCAAEFEAYTPYYYSTYGSENEMRRTERRKIMILGGGPNRIGQGIEFDYCCVHAAFALRELDFETIMVNSNPETVSTDYDTSDKLYFEPLTLEDVLNIYDQEQPEGVIVQFGGQTPLNLADGLRAANVPILGTQPESIERAEDRKLFAAMLDELGLRQTPSGSAVSADEALAIAQKVGYPVLVRPSFVLGGRAMELVYNDDDLHRYMSNTAIEVSPDRPVLVDRFLEDAIEVDVDCIADGEIAVIGAIMEHVQLAGIHSGDSACAVPTFSLPEKVLSDIRHATKAMAKALEVRGLMNVQFAVKGDDVYVLEVNPRASRTVPFVSKAIGVPLAKLAAKIMAGKTLTELGFTEEILPEAFLGQGAGLSVSALSGKRHDARPRDEIDRRSHGHRYRSRPRLREIADGRAAAAAEVGQHLHQRERCRQTARRPAGARFHRARFRHYRDERNGRDLERRRDSGHARLQAARRPPACARPDHERRRPAHHQHAERQDPARRRTEDAQRRALHQNPDHHHDARGARERHRHSRAAVARSHGQDPAGVSSISALLPTYPPYPFAIVRGAGDCVFDERGRRYFDFYGGHCVCSTGHAHPKVAAAIARQANELLFYSTAAEVPIRNEAAEALVRFANSRGDIGIASVFFCNSGSEANENALKVAAKLTGRHRFAAFEGGWHGRGTLPLSVTDDPKISTPYTPLLAPCDRLPWNDEAALDAFDFSAIAAVILEPIQSMSGIRPATKSFLQKLRAATARRRTLF